MSTAQPLPSITPRTLAIVQDLMQREGLDAIDAEQVALYLERLSARERFFRTVDDARQRTQDVPADELQRTIDEAVDEVETSHRGCPGGAPS